MNFPLSFINLSNAISICLLTQTKTYDSTTQNLGFDSVYGTYYTYTTVSSLSARPTAVMSGFNQSPGQFIPDNASYYSIIGFTFPAYTNSWNPSAPPPTSDISSILTTAQVVTIQNLMGTPIPYPYGATASASSVFYDGTFTPTGQDLVISSAPFPGTEFGPKAGPPPTQSVSQYEQSIPIVNSHLHYIVPENIITNPTGFMNWSTIPVIPDYIHTSVYDPTVYSSNTDANSSWLNGYMLFQAGGFTIAKYPIFTNISPYSQANRNFTVVGVIGMQQLYPDIEKTSLIAVGGNDSNYVFVGSSNLQLRFKVYNPLTGILIEQPINTTYKFNTNYQLQHFVYNNSNAWFYSAYDTLTGSIKLEGAAGGTNTTFIQKSFANTEFSELQLASSGKYVYFSSYLTNGFTQLRLYSLDPTSSQYIGNSQGFTVNLNTTPVPVNPYYTQFAVTVNNGVEEVLLTNTDFNPSVYFKIRNYLVVRDINGNIIPNTSNTNIDQSTQIIETFPRSGVTVSIKRILGGAYGSKWVLSDSTPYVLGNRNDAYDTPNALAIGWQIFFPDTKIEFRKLTNSSTPILDLANIQYPEWPHTCMFAYSNYNSMYQDISGNWGLEKDFIVSDVSFNGFYYNSYLVNIPLKDTSEMPVGDYSNAYTYLAIRGYLPTEKFQTMVRFYLPNRYDFGFIKLSEIAPEIILSRTIPQDFNPEYSATLQQFDSNFIFPAPGRLFGVNTLQSLPGSNIVSQGFADFLNQYIGFQSTISTASVQLELIQSTVKSGITEFVQSNLQYILPSSILTRTRFVDPILSQILWQDYLTPNYTGLDDNWGLGWNLGYAKSNTDFSIFHTAESFYKIQDQYIYLRLNPEFNINGMDAGGKENYKTTREPSGTTNQYYCKLLLTTFGGNATTFIHNPISFNPPVNRLTKLTFQWIDVNGNIINNNDCDWNMTVNISERSDVTTVPPASAAKPPFIAAAVDKAPAVSTLSTITS